MTTKHAPIYRGFRLVTGAVAIALGSLLVLGLFHESSTPAVLSRWGIGYACFLALVLISFLVCLWGLWKPPLWLVSGLTNLYVLSASLLVSLILVEVGLRIVNPWGMDFFHWLPYHMQGMIDHPQLGYVHPRSVSYRLGHNPVRLNAQGLRDREIPYEKPDGEKRILLLGDSVTFGWGVSQGESFGDQMEPLLESSSGRRWEVINAGVNGYNTEQEAIYFRIEGLRYEPDIVIVTYLENDIESIIDPNIVTWRRYPAWPSSLPEALGRLKSLSYSYQLAGMFIRARQLAAQRAGEAQGGTSHLLTSNPRWAASKRHLKEIATLCAERDIGFVVAAFSIRDPAFYLELRQAGIDTISLGAAFENIPEHQQYVSKVDPHPTAVGHRAMAELLVRSLEQKKLLN
jgi:hypothetical protein